MHACVLGGLMGTGDYNDDDGGGGSGIDGGGSHGCMRARERIRMESDGCMHDAW
jgi:hypothetical protein